MSSFVAVLVAVLLCVSRAAASSSNDTDAMPQQIHVSYGEDPTSLVVTWSTYSLVNESAVEICSCRGPLCLPRLCGAPRIVQGTVEPFVDGGVQNRTQWIHRARLTDLFPDKRYGYTCGGAGQWSDFFVVQTMPKHSNWSPRLAVYGDLGLQNARSIPRLYSDVIKGMYDAVLHVGDLCYDMHENQSYKGDAFMNMIQPIAARLPYMVCPGNHEERYNFSNYVSRFSMPNSVSNLFYSFDIGPAHIVSLSTELYYYTNYGTDQIKNQYEWLERDLQYANSAENRTKHPWIITIGHRPMYCTNDNINDCLIGSFVIRNGLPVVAPYALEPLFYNYGVDLSIWGHKHSYERMWPIYDGTVYNGSYEMPYKNPTAPVHIVTGSAGNKEKLAKFGKSQPFSAYRISDYGYGRMTVHNATHLYFEQVSDDKDGTVVDNMWLIKDSHGPYPARPRQSNPASLLSEIDIEEKR